MLLSSIASLSQAQGNAAAWPNKPIRLIAPYPAGESIDSVARLTAQHWSAALAVPELRNRLIGQGAEPLGSTPEEFRSALATEMEIWKKLVKDNNIKAED